MTANSKSVIATRSALARRIRSSAFAVVLAAIAILFTPPPTDSQLSAVCASVRSSSRYLAIVQSCDSHLFVRLAHRPAALLEEDGRLWQSRPLFPVLGSVFALPVGAVKLAVRAVGAKPGDRFDPYYYGYVLLNAVLLTGALVIFLRLLGSATPFDPVLALPVMILLVNGVTKAFFWMPHLQVFNVLSPIAGVALGFWLPPRFRELSLPALTLIGLVAGLSALAYGAFIVAFASGVVAVLATTTRGQWRGTLGRVVYMSAAFAAPIAGWWLFVTLKTGSFYSHEVHGYGQFVWVAEAAGRGWPALGEELGVQLKEFGTTFGPALGFTALLVAAALFAAAILRIKTFAPEDRRPVQGIASYVAVALPFYALMGFYQPRLTWVFVPPVLLILAVVLRRIARHLDGRAAFAFKGAVTLLAIAYALRTLAEPSLEFLR